MKLVPPALRHRKQQFKQFPAIVSERGARIASLAEKGDARELKELLEDAPPELVDTADQHGFTPLMHACCEGHAVVVRLLLSHGADVSIINHDGESALHLAASIGYDEIVSLLIEKGADPHVRTHRGKSAAELAATMGHDRVLAVLGIEDGHLPDRADVVSGDPAHTSHTLPRAPDSGGLEPRDLAFELLEVDYTKLNHESLNELATILQMSLEKVEEARQRLHGANSSSGAGAAGSHGVGSQGVHSSLLGES
mmetsp:Transcript_9392/g.24301  ORF Transcript_9392/g.24301 Transcript_9392/m.24301 type:complete len:253 (+) Transcript_9392:126-884(+)